MKIGIHKNIGSFSDCWISYCEENKIAYKIVDCYKNDIIDQLSNCDALMWHFHHASPRDVLFAKQLLYSVKASGKQIFPDFDTVWHFDDKVGQKYLLESIGSPLVPSYVFYTKKEAMIWAQSTDFPKVFKLRGGAGSANVRLAHTREEAVKLINIAFGRGFSQYDGWGNLKERIRQFKLGKTNLWDVIKGVIRLVHTTEFAKISGSDRGYIYFQDFIANNDSDIRVIVIDHKAFAIRRMVRENDFRASGSGNIRYEKENFDLNTIKLTFDLANKINSQCLAVDYVYQNGTPLIVEISYGYVKEVYYSCEGYWSSDMIWHEGSFNSQQWMVEMLLSNK